MQHQRVTIGQVDEMPGRSIELTLGHSGTRHRQDRVSVTAERAPGQRRHRTVFRRRPIVQQTTHDSGVILRGAKDLKLCCMKTIRTFLAIPLPDDLARSAGQLILSTRQDGDGIKWVPEDNLHLTLKFLGEVENIETPRVCTALEEVCANFEPFDLVFEGTSGLPDAERARVLTVRIDDPSGSLVKLAAEIELTFADLGYKREPRDYRPHLTLGRARSNVRRANADVVQRWLAHADRPLGEMRVDHVQVVGSFLEKRGPVYNVMDTVDL